MNKDARIYVAGAQTLIGAALLRGLELQGYTKIINGTREEPELTSAIQVDRFFGQFNPDYVFLAGGRSGGISANQKYPAELMLNNLLVECHVIHSAYRHRVRKLLYLASSCSYPKDSPQPMRVESLFTGSLEPTSEPYAMAKLAGIKLCQAYHRQYGVNFISGIPADTFGPHDNFDTEDSHVVAALIRKMHEAKERDITTVEVWGSGNPRREFIFVDDLARGCIFVMDRYDEPRPINIGGGTDLSIRELTEVIKDVVGYKGELRFNTEKPDGMPVKVLDSTKLRQMGWRIETPFQTAISVTYDWFVRSQKNGR